VADDDRSALEHDVEPGQTLQDSMVVQNLSDLPIELQLYAADAVNTADGSYNLLVRDAEDLGVGAWTTVEQETIVLAPGQEQEVGVTIAVPDNATPGDHAGGVVASLRSTQTDTQVALEQRVGVRTYLRVAGELEPSLSIQDLDISFSGGAAPTGGTITATYTLVNDGNVRLGGRDELEVTGPFDATVAEEALPAFSNLLPGSAVEREIVVHGVTSWVRLEAELAVIPDVDPAAEGLIDIERRSVKLWAVPWLTLAIVAVAVGGLWAIRRRRGGAPDADGPTDDPTVDDGEPTAATTADATDSNETEPPGASPTEPSAAAADDDLVGTTGDASA